MAEEIKEDYLCFAESLLLSAKKAKGAQPRGLDLRVFAGEEENYETDNQKHGILRSLQSC